MKIFYIFVQFINIYIEVIFYINLFSAKYKIKVLGLFIKFICISRSLRSYIYRKHSLKEKIVKDRSVKNKIIKFAIGQFILQYYKIVNKNDVILLIYYQQKFLSASFECFST